MRTYLSRVLLIVAVVLAASAPAFAQGIVRGKVVDAAGKPVEGASVVIESTSNGRKATTKTDKNGEFTQIGVSTGAVTVTVSKDTLTTTSKGNVGQARPAVLAITLAPGSGLSPEQQKEAAAMATLAQAALASLQAGNDDVAIQQFNEIVGKMPTCADCYYNLGVAYSKKQQWAEAEAAFTKVTELKPDSGEAFAGLANVYNSQKQYDKAAAASAKAQQLSGAAGGGASAEATYNQGVILWNSGKYAEAKSQFEAAIKADPKMAMAHYQLGMANLNLGQMAEARTAFEGYLAADPNGPKAAEVKAFLTQLPK